MDVPNSKYDYSFYVFSRNMLLFLLILGHGFDVNISMY